MLVERIQAITNLFIAKVIRFGKNYPRCSSSSEAYPKKKNTMGINRNSSLHKPTTATSTAVQIQQESSGTAHPDRKESNEMSQETCVIQTQAVAIIPSIQDVKPARQSWSLNAIAVTHDSKKIPRNPIIQAGKAKTKTPATMHQLLRPPPPECSSTKSKPDAGRVRFARYSTDG